MSDPAHLGRPSNGVVLDGPWRGSSVPVVRRISGYVWVLGVLCCPPMVLLLHPLPADAPTADAAAIAWAAVVVVGAVWCLHPRTRIGLRAILALVWVELIALAVLQHHAGGWAASYYQLIGIHAVAVAACFPPRAAVPYVAVAVLATLLPLVTGADDGRTVDVLLHTFSWLGLSVVGLVAMRRIRAQRLVLAADARLDRLTQIGNRYAFDADVGPILDEARTAGRRVGVGLGDLDGFKRINDEHGHLVGDGCLLDVAGTLVAACGTSGTAYRWAGDEFVVLLFGEDDDDLRRRCAAVTVAGRDAGRTPDDTPLRLTFGWAQADVDAPDGAALLAAADERLMRAKRDRLAARAVV